jgi:hypothetical protein
LAANTKENEAFTFNKLAISSNGEALKDVKKEIADNLGQ